MLRHTFILYCKLASFGRARTQRSLFCLREAITSFFLFFPISIWFTSGNMFLTHFVCSDSAYA